MGCGTVQEKFCPRRPRPMFVPCDCGAQALYVISAPHLDPRMGIDAEAFPTMGERWAKAHTDQLAKEKKHA